MAHLFQVGAGSGGMVVLDLLTRDPAITRVTLVEPDLYKPHNVIRHLFPSSGVGRFKAELAAEWIRDRRPDLVVDTLPVDVTDPAHQSRIRDAVASCDIGVCAADNEQAKYHVDQLMRTQGKPWTLGEVLSGGIAGWVHCFTPDGPCYGCVASHLQRERPTVTDPLAPPPDYRQPGGTVPETTIPASRASIDTIAGLHALLTQERLTASEPPDCTSLLFALRRVEGVFDQPYRIIR
ncbi:MAG: ThiF family adenylyltransferase, partial [Bacteroidales bacterium]|nr:ThiF family adenylyltransferase [Bacteroidales bacterium]